MLYVIMFYFFLVIIFKIILYILANATGEEKEIKVIQAGKGEIKLPLFDDDSQPCGKKKKN